MSTPTPEDMKRDLAADFAEYEDMQRECGFGLAFGEEHGGYRECVYEYAKFALGALPTALRRAAHAESLNAELLAALERVEPWVATYANGPHGQDCACDLCDMRAAIARGRAIRAKRQG